MKLHTKPKPSVMAQIKSALDSIDHHRTEVTGIELSRSEANQLISEINNGRAMFVPECTLDEAFIQATVPLNMSGVRVFMEGHPPLAANEEQ